MPEGLALKVPLYREVKKKSIQSLLGHWREKKAFASTLSRRDSSKMGYGCVGLLVETDLKKKIWFISFDLKSLLWQMVVIR